MLNFINSFGLRTKKNYKPWFHDTPIMTASKTIEIAVINDNLKLFNQNQTWAYNKEIIQL